MQHFPNSSFNFEKNLGQNLNDTASLVNISGFGTINIWVIPPTGGQVAFEGTSDDINWFPITFRGQTSDGYTQRTSTTQNFVGSIVGLRQIRFRTSIAGSASGTIVGMLSRFQAILEGIEHQAPPHKFGYVPIFKDFNFTTTQTDTDIWIPNAGKKIVITDFHIVASGNVDANAIIFFQTNQTGTRLFNTNLDLLTNAPFTFSYSTRTPFVAPNTNDRLRVTTTGAPMFAGVVNGYEVDG